MSMHYAQITSQYITYIPVFINSSEQLRVYGWHPTLIPFFVGYTGLYVQASCFIHHTCSNVIHAQTYIALFSLFTSVLKSGSSLETRLASPCKHHNRNFLATLQSYSMKYITHAQTLYMQPTSSLEIKHHTVNYLNST